MLGTAACPRCLPTRPLQPPQEDFKAQYFLWQLLCIENDARRARAEAARRRAEAEKADEGLEGVEREVAAKRKQAAGIHKQRALLERKVAKRRAEMEKKVRCHGLPWRASELQGVQTPPEARVGSSRRSSLQTKHIGHPHCVRDCTCQVL